MLTVLSHGLVDGCYRPVFRAASVGTMAARIDARVRQLIINFPDRPRRGEVTRFCREHGISRAEFYKVRARAKTEGKLAAVTPRQPVAKSVKRRTSQELVRRPGGPGASHVA